MHTSFQEKFSVSAFHWNDIYPICEITHPKREVGALNLSSGDDKLLSQALLISTQRERERDSHATMGRSHWLKERILWGKRTPLPPHWKAKGAKVERQGGSGFGVVGRLWREVKERERKREDMEWSCGVKNWDYIEICAPGESLLFFVVSKIRWDLHALQLQRQSRKPLSNVASMWGRQFF